MRTTSVAGAAICLASLCSLDASAGESRGNDALRTERREVAAFDAVEIASGIRATVAMGPQAPLELTGDASALARVETRVTDGRLRVDFRRRHFGPFDDREIRVKIVVPRLRGAEASGGAILRAALARVEALELAASGGGELHISGIDTGELAASGSGGAELDLQGAADRLSLEMSGGTRVRAARLATKSMRVSGSGGSEAEVRVSESVRGELSGGSSVRAIGKPSTNVATSGGSSVETRD
jgi:Putative auto-transporter adhesin, head GIN domain